MLLGILTRMTALSLALVLLSAIFHATWNYLLKRSNNPEIFTWWMQVSISLSMIPLAVILAWRYPIVYPGWWFVLATTLLHVLYFIFLARGYKGADLSVVYPIARGIGPALVPVLGVLVIKETVAPMAIAGIVAVIVGIYTVYWWGHIRQILQDPLKILKESGTRYALLAGLSIASFSVVDKVGVRSVSPFLYMYLMSLGTALFLVPYMLKVHGTRAMLTEWRSNPGSIVAAGGLAFLAYGLILSAFQLSRVSYVAPAREVGIVMAVLLGILVLKEPFGRGRVLGSSFIVTGLILIALAP